MPVVGVPNYSRVPQTLFHLQRGPPKKYSKNATLHKLMQMKHIFLGSSKTQHRTDLYMAVYVFMCFICINLCNVMLHILDVDEPCKL